MVFTDAAKQVQIERIAYRWLRFNIVITSSQGVYDKSDPAKRTIIYIGNSNGKNPGYGGMTYGIGSSDVYADRMSGSNINIGECAAHESGHSTIGLQHHVTWSSTCTMTASYSQTPCSTMGYCYGIHNGFILGTSPYGCSTTQNDPILLSTKFGIRPGQTL